MDDFNTSEDTLGGESQLNSAPVESTVNNESQPVENLTLSEMNQHLGKDFKDKDTALKALKDTFSYVGKKKEDILKEFQSLNNTDALAKEIKQIKENSFYKDNPNFAPYRELIGKLGENPEEAVQLPSFKAVFEKAQGYDESTQLKTVLQSSPRLQSSRDNLSKARDAMKAGNREQSEALATRAALEAFDM